MAKPHRIIVGDIAVDVVPKAIKNLHLGVYPPDGQVRVSAPLHFDDEAIRLAIISRLPWIRRQQRSFARQERESQREMVSGESHWVAGRRYLLEVVEGPRPDVAILNAQTLRLTVRPGSDRDRREAVLERWYRARLRAAIPPLLAKWEPIIGVTANEVRIKKMKTRWGSCTVEVKRIWLNFELAKKSPACLEYILVHELVHLLERHHNARFLALMDRFLPQWEARRAELNRAPLAHAEWGY
ncbi:MAG: M48 family metallopeptidase [Anaerolineales bacterium]|nr:M48 family metallopeptidase [Anaerolineales bacterium]MCB9127965.1 M48 family metallopeptidase [Ardenticatenales bacterium]MCB9171726.1 M48 family metallopeptidase [Ardenticatenales bacterium]